ncbi:MerR family transcriptional regulator [Azospirillum soli]|uniref:MerR family transcriptional regulator n=1 Tax=Azospirillum soli TaxID=1304799 RepID=UPI001AE6E911|nr:MerR family transcriptional regulator [Azospirillum soli]MBP2315993.1 DNA-binding transcriptional MerR regulator [Azospirillum soli]
MFTIAGLARRTDLPRRIVQFWADKGAIVAAKTEGDAPRLFSTQELRIARLLAQLHSVGASIATIRTFAGAIRITLQDAEYQREGHTAETIDTALSGEPAWLIVSFPNNAGDERSENALGGVTSSFTEFDGGGGWDWTYRFTKDETEVGAVVTQMTSVYPTRPVVVFNLTQALYYRPNAAKMEDE